ncbi:MAG: bifunctional folylpolyglutamate synthase/dihydrofolate synthase [Clostridiales bacterium]|jgi:dihydrofolate synthase/folylpolyglutamate synthase|nr:bifunctional folylpolyglutamate synthase/dihydrofolate synthase [Clostridiales bacterium]
MGVDIEGALSFIHSVTWKGRKLGLGRVDALLESLGGPHKKLKFIHIAGTNGKGSTASMLAHILEGSGYKTGLYTSPYIHKFNERMQINGSPISDSGLVALTDEIRAYVSKMQDKPSEFEIITAIAMLYFYNHNCDIVVLEVGLGGRLDTTNVIPVPEVALITPIGFDHTDLLGGALEEIAAEKAGIIKAGGDVISSPQEAGAARVIAKKCSEVNANISFVDANLIKPISQNLDGQQFDFGGFKGLELALLGSYQLMNAALAVSAVQLLQKKGWKVTEKDLRNGLKKATWPGRFEVMNKKPIFIVDGAHNPQGARAVVEGLSQLANGRKIIFLIGVLADKGYPEMIEILAPVAKCFFVVTPDNPRALEAEVLSLKIMAYGLEATVCRSVGQGVSMALGAAGGDGIACALGSLYLTGPLRDCFKGR